MEKTGKRMLSMFIEQERQLITHYEARQARAEGTAAAAIAAVLALAALTATAAETSDEVDKTFGWIVVGVLACACVAALVVRSVAGLRHTSTSVLSMGTAEFGTALEHLRACGSTNLDPIDVRQRTLALCHQRADDAHDAAKSKDRWAAFAAIALAVAVALTASFAVNLFTVRGRGSPARHSPPRTLTLPAGGAGRRGSGSRTCRLARQRSTSTVTNLTGIHPPPSASVK